MTALSPDLASRWAERLFASPRRHTRPDHEETILAGGSPFEFLAGERVLRAWRWGRGPVVMLVHGWEGRGSQLGAFVEPLVQSGFRVVAFDAPAHGDSPGHRSGPHEFAEAILALDRWVGGVRAAIGHSMGALGLSVAMNRGLALDRAVFVSPGYGPTRATAEVAALLDLAPSVLEGMRRTLAERAGKTWSEVEASTTVEEPYAPLLVVHDRGDREIDFQVARKLTEDWPCAQLMATEGLGHRRILWARAVTERVAAFVEEGVDTSTGELCRDPWQEFLHGDFGFDFAWV